MSLIESYLNKVLLSNAIQQMVNHNQHVFEICDFSSVHGWNYCLISNSDHSTMNSRTRPQFWSKTFGGLVPSRIFPTEISCIKPKLGIGFNDKVSSFIVKSWTWGISAILIWRRELVNIVVMSGLNWTLFSFLIFWDLNFWFQASWNCKFEIFSWKIFRFLRNFEYRRF